MAPVQPRPMGRVMRTLGQTVTTLAVLAAIIVGMIADRAAAREKVPFGGSVDLLSGDGSSLVNARMAGADVIAIGVTLGVLSGKVIAAKEITTPQQLKGKKWAISSFGSEAQMAEQLFLKLNGLAETDVTTVQVGNQGNRFAALEAGQVQVSTFLPPTSAKVEAAGYHVIAQLPELAPEYMSVPVGISIHTLQQRRPMVKAFLEALIEATVAFKKDRAGGIEVIKKYLKSNDADAAVAYDYYAPLYDVSLRPTPKMVQFLLDHSADPKAKTMRPEEFYDVSLLEEIAKARGTQ